MVLVSRKKQQLEKLFSMVVGPEGAPLVSEPQADASRSNESLGIEHATWAGHELDVRVRQLDVVELPASEPEEGHRYLKAGPREHPPAVVVPSGTESRGETLEPKAIGERIKIQGDPEWRIVGEVFHGFLAADRSQEPLERLEMARGLIERWGLADNLRAEDLVAASDGLRKWIKGRWPNASQHREWPIHHRLANGSEVHGSADLVLELESRFVLIDHKTFPGGAEQARAEAAGYGGQLGIYSEALSAATGKKLERAFIHLPVSGMVVEVKTESRG